jgi:DNA polymerase (family X)
VLARIASLQREARPGSVSTFKTGMTKLEAPEVADLLLEIGQRATLEGGNPYKAKAYIRVAEGLRSLVTPLGEVIRRAELRAIPGIGDAIARRIIELRDKGTDEGLERLRRSFPASLLELLSIPRLKPGVVVKLHKELGINSAAEAEEAARQGRLRKVKGLGAAVERKILEGLALARSAAGQMRVNRAEELLLHACGQLERQGAGHVTIAGDFRRGCELAGDLLVVASSDENIARGKLGGVRVDIVPQERFGSALLYLTGNAQHIGQLEALARNKRLSLSASGIGKPGREPGGRTEDEIYHQLGLTFIPPELREGGDEIALAQARKLPKLVTEDDLKGILHVHTDFSDGVHSLREMAEAAIFRSTTSSASTNWSTSSTGSLAAFASSRGSSPTSWPTARWTTRRRCSRRLISWWRACTAGSGWERQSRLPAS